MSEQNETKKEVLTKDAAKQAENSALAAPLASGTTSIFADIHAFEAAQRMVKPLAQSNLVPDTFRGNLGDCMIALEYANRIGASPLMVMQNLYVVHGKPAWSSQFLIACANKSGKFSPLRYRMTGEQGTDSFGCIAWAIDSSGETLDSPEVTVAMAKREGWYGKNGSKWQTMPALMLRYRAATLFVRLYAPELTMGISTDDEVRDIYIAENSKNNGGASRFDKKAEVITDAEEVTPEEPNASDLERLQTEIDKRGIPLEATAIKDYVEKSGDIFSFELIYPMLNTLAEKIIGAPEGR